MFNALTEQKDTPEASLSAHPVFWEKMVPFERDRSLADMAEEKPVLVVFLRFFGCSFCREAISDIAKLRKKLEKQGFGIVFVHMAADPQVAEKFFKRYKLYPVDHIPDPEKSFYHAFGLIKGAPQQIFSFMNFLRGFQAAVLEGHGASPPSPELGDGFQMPGVFVLHKGQILKSFVHQNAYDRPDYEEICRLDRPL